MIDFDFHRIWDTRKMENRFRRVLGLPPLPEGWIGPGFRIMPEENGLRRMEMLDPEDKQKDLEQERQEGWRRRWASGLALMPWTVERGIQSAYHRNVDPVRRTRALSQIGESRWLTFSSPYILEIGAGGEVEGILRAPGCKGLSFTIATLGYLDSQSRQEWSKGSVLNTAEYGTDVYLVVPEKTLTPENILKALQHWYLETYSWDDQHWSSREDHLPNFQIDVEWQEWREYWRQGLQKKELSMSDQEYQQHRKKTLARYNRENRAKREKLYERFGLK